MQKKTITKNDVFDSASKLGVSISKSIKFEQFKKDQDRFLKDENLQNLYKNYLDVYTEYEAARQHNGDSQDLVIKLKNIEKQLFDFDIFRDLISSQNEFFDYLKLINSEISSNLMFDFASLAKTNI